MAVAQQHTYSDLGIVCFPGVHNDNKQDQHDAKAEQNALLSTVDGINSNCVTTDRCS